MPILTQSGRVAVAESVAARPIHLAWGSGDGLWTTPPAENSSAVALLNELGRRAVTSVQYVVPDVAGAIILSNGSYSLSTPPTKSLLFTVNFDFVDAPGMVIREVGLFLGSTTDAGLPIGQRYFIPAEVTAPGRLLHLENIAPIFRSPSIRENFEIVLTF